MPGLHFDITASNENFKQRLSEVSKGVRDAARLMKGVSSSFDTSTAEGKMMALMTAIRETESVAGKTMEKMGRLRQEALSALAEGNVSDFESISVDIENRSAILDEASKKLERYKNALASMQEATGMGIMETSSPVRFFADQSDYEYAKQLRSEITAIQAAIANTETPDSQIDALKERLDSTTERLHRVEDSATSAASRLGADLGGKAADASTRLYELNNAVAKQEADIKSLTSAVASAKAEYDNLQSANISDDESVQIAKEKYDNLSESLRNAQNALSELKAQQSDAKNAWGEVSREIQQHDSILVKMLGGQEKFKTIMAGMPPALQSSAQGIAGMTGAAKAFIATPLGLILGAIILAVKALTTWFNSSADGQMEFARISGYVSGVLGQLKEIVIAVGKALFKAFSDPKQAVSDLWQHIKTNLLNRLDGIGGALKNFGKGVWSALTFDFDAAGDSFKQMGKDILKVSTGIDDIGGKMEAFGKRVDDVAKKNAELNVREKQLHRDRREWSKEEQKMENEISQLRLKAQRGDMSANKKAQELINQKYARQISYQKEELAIIKERNALTTNSDEDYDKEAEAEKKLLALEAQRNQELSFFNRKDFSLGNKAETLAEKQLNAQVKLGQELAELQRRNDADAIEAMEEGTAKKLRQIENDYVKRRNEIAKQEASWRKENKAAGRDEDLDEEQRTALDQATELNERLRQKAVGEVYQAEFAAMRDNLRQYGTYQQQKLAIAEEYAEKIKKASSEGERRSLERERDSAMAKATTAQIKDRIDWKVVFGEFGGMFHKVIEPVLADAKKYMQTDEFKNADHDSQQALVEAVRKMEASVGKVSTASFSQLGKQIEAYSKSLDELSAAQDKYKSDYELLTRAQNEYKVAMQRGSGMQKHIAKVALDAAQANADASAENVRSLQENVDANMQVVTDSATTLSDAMKGVVSGLQQLSSGSLSGVYQGLIGLGRSAEKLGGKLGASFGKMADKLDSVPIIGWIASIIDIFKDGLSVVVGGILDAVFDAVSGILDDILSGQLFVTLGESILSGVGKIFDALSFGGFSKLFGFDVEQDEKYEKGMELLTESNKALQFSIDRLTEKMDDASVTDAESAYKESMAKLAESERNTRKQIQDSGAEYKAGFLGIGGQHSSNKALDDGMSNSEWDRISKVTGKNVRHAWALWGLSSEEMLKVATELPDIFAKIKTLGNDGYKDAAQYLDAYVDYARQREEIERKFQEQITGTSYDALKSNFVNTLLDMEADAESIGEDISRTLMEAMVNNLMGEKYNKKLEEWYGKYAAAMSASGGKLTKKQSEELKAEYLEIINSAKEDAKGLAEITGYDNNSKYKQEASRGGFEALGEDTGKELNGRFTAVAESSERTAAAVTAGVMTLTNMSSAISDGNEILSDIRSVMAVSNTYLSDIAKHTKPILKLEEKMDALIENTKYN